MACDTDKWIFVKDAGNIVRPEFHIIASYVQMETTEDSFTHGETGRTHTVWRKSNLGTFKDIQSLVNKLDQMIGVPTDLRSWSIDRGGMIEANYHVDEQNAEATDREIAEWKKGETRLWSARLSVQVAFSRIWTPDVSAMKNTLGLQIY